MLKLTELEPQFMKVIDESTAQYVDSIAEADGIMFVCPKCFAEKGDRPGVHSVVCWTPKVSPDRSPKPGRWSFEGTGYHDLTLVAGSSSVLLLGGCDAHFFVRRGEIVMC